MSSGNQLPNLDKIFREDDELDFQPLGGSNLAAIFGVQVKGQDIQSSTKQQQHKKLNSGRNLTQTVPTNTTEVILAKAVRAFKLQNGVYVSLGKLGIALTGNLSTKAYEIILYKSKQEHVSVVTVMHDFVYTVQPNNYSSYYDSNNENWSILFESNDVCIEFAREIGLARYFSRAGRLDNVLYQDLTPINKDVVAKEGDDISIKYFISTEILQPFKNNSIMLQTMTVEISTDDNWERILLGTSKGLKRILFLPPNKQISLGPGFPKEKDITLEIEIVEIKRSEKLPQPHKSVSNKASIISRMAKMGQSILPKIPTPTTTDSEDTEDDVPHKSIRHKKVEPLEGILPKKSLSQDSEEVPKHIHKIVKSKSDVSTAHITSPKPLVPTSTFTPQWSPTQMQSNYVTLDGQVYSLQPQPIAPAISTVIDPGLNMLLSETRMTNAELRMGMTKVADNVQKLLDKFHALELQNAATPTSERDSTLKLLLAINKAQVGTKDNELQKTTDTSSSNNWSELNEVKSRVTVLEQELKEGKEQLITSREHIKTLETQKEFLERNNENTCKRIEELEALLQSTKDAFERTKEDLEQTKTLNSDYQKTNVALEDKISKLLTECKVLEKTASSLDEKDSDSKNKEIKHIMNRTYHTLLEKFVDDSYSTDYIKSTIANTIKNITLHVLYESNEKGAEKTESVKDTGTDVTKIDNENRETSTSNSSVANLSCQNEISKTNIGNTISALQDEPPPIPQMDSDDDHWWQ